ncbi:MAG TPA: hypothetical protein VKU00_31805 [Chthonomonadaceae bacterium]|nr:hypothetical protein [Chthonomonadaceae bacterium]
MNTLAHNTELIRPILPNLVLAWLWIVLGFGFGALMGMRFQDENWLGGYGSFPRRLYRLGHIAFFGLAIINLLFFFTVCLIGRPRDNWALSAWGFGIGAITMPLSCLLMAHWPRARPLFVFAVPVASLLLAGLTTLWKVLNLL